MTNTTQPNGQRYWLKEHQITAFWHEFGISNGLYVPKEKTRTFKYKRSKQEYIIVDAEFMRGALKEYIKWLKNYGEAWNTREDHPHGVDTREAFLESEKIHESRADVLAMIELLQKYRIDDTN